MTVQDSLNQVAYVRPDSMKWYESLEGFCDPGERAAYGRIADEVRGQPILDLGVGAGRTTALLGPLTPHYTALDYLPDMVAAVRRRHPSVDVSLGDARDLSRFADGSFAMVAFSFNGIDSIDHEGRQQVLAEVHRVLRPGGVFWFSTLNQAGPSRRERPWRVRPREVGGRRAALRAVLRLPSSIANYLRGSRAAQRGDGWETASLSAHSYALMAHYTTLARQLAELEDAGFQPRPAVFGSDGSEVHGEHDAQGLAGVAWFQVLARR